MLTENVIMTAAAVVPIPEAATTWRSPAMIGPIIHLVTFEVIPESMSYGRGVQAEGFGGLFWF